MKLDEFLNQDRVRAQHVIHPEFWTLFVRHSQRMIDEKLTPCLDIATVEAKHKGKGAFTRLIASMSDLDKPLYAESVLNPRLAQWLLRNGWIAHNVPDCYYKTK